MLMIDMKEGEALSSLKCYILGKAGKANISHN